MLARRLAILLAAIVCCSGILFSQEGAPKQPSVTKRQPAVAVNNGQPAKQDSQTSAPPITMVVQEQAGEEPAETKRRDREIEIQERIALFTAMLVVAAALTGLVVGWQSFESRKSANAARLSAQIAEQSLRLLNQPWLDTDNWEATPRVTWEDSPGYTKPANMIVAFEPPKVKKLQGIIVSFNITNESKTPATLLAIDMRDYGSGSPEMDYGSKSDLGDLITPGGKYPHQAEITEMSPRQIENYWNGKGFVVEIRGTIEFSDLFSAQKIDGDGVRKRHFGRRCLLRDGLSEFNPIAGAEAVEPDPYTKSQRRPSEQTKG